MNHLDHNGLKVYNGVHWDEKNSCRRNEGRNDHPLVIFPRRIGYTIRSKLKSLVILGVDFDRNAVMSTAVNRVGLTVFGHFGARLSFEVAAHPFCQALNLNR